MNMIDNSVSQLKGSIVVGDITIAKNSSIWFNAVVRGDMASIRIGENTNVQDNAVIHVSQGKDVKIGDNVTIGHSAIIHSCHIGSNTLIGMGAIIMDNASIGANCMIGAGSLVPSNTIIPDNMVAFGNPVKIQRGVTREDMEHIKKNAEEYAQLAKKYVEKKDET